MVSFLLYLHVEPEIIKEETIKSAKDFLALGIEKQRELFGKKDKASKQELGETIRSFFDIIKNVNGDPTLVKYFILLIDGIIEGIYPLSEL